jgi:hypothetical protein
MNITTHKLQHVGEAQNIVACVEPYKPIVYNCVVQLVAYIITYCFFCRYLLLKFAIIFCDCCHSWRFLTFIVKVTVFEVI